MRKYFQDSVSTHFLTFSLSTLPETLTRTALSGSLLWQRCFLFDLRFKGGSCPEKEQRSAEGPCFSVLEHLLSVKRAESSFHQGSPLETQRQRMEFPLAWSFGESERSCLPGDLAVSILTQPAFQVGEMGVLSASKEPGNGRLVT